LQQSHFVTLNFTLLCSVPLEVTTSTTPEVAQVGTVAVRYEEVPGVNTADVPLKVTLVMPVRLVPRIVMSAPSNAAVQTPEIPQYSVSNGIPVRCMESLF
jgi:hypothetical protein